MEEYYEKLCKKFPQISFNTNGGVVPCNSNKVVVNLSYDCLKKMANDPEFAKEIEWNLSGEVAANSQVYSFAKRDGVELGGRTVTYDANGNRQSSCGGMRTANSSNKSSDVLSTQNQQKAAKSRRDKKREQEEYLEKMREKRKRDICIVSSRYNFAYSSGLSMASAFNAQSDPGVVFKSFSASQQSMRSI